MYRLCWLCIFDFGFVRDFLNMGPSCCTNYLVLFAFAHKKEAAWSKTFQVRGPCIVLISSCHLGLLTHENPPVLQAPLGLWRAGGEWAKGETEQRKGVGATLSLTLTDLENFSLSGVPCPGTFGTLTFCSAWESNLFSLLERTYTKSLCLYDQWACLHLVLITSSQNIRAVCKANSSSNDKTSSAKYLWSCSFSSP